MKKVKFMKLNLQQENVLTKEEKKNLLGGYGNSCYVTRTSGGEIAVGNCDKATIEFYCGGGGEHSGCYCVCKS